MMGPIVGRLCIQELVDGHYLGTSPLQRILLCHDDQLRVRPDLFGGYEARQVERGAGRKSTNFCPTLVCIIETSIKKFDAKPLG